MQRIDTSDGRFHAGDPSTGALGTIVTADYMQSLQEEIASAVETAGLTLDPNDNSQLTKAIRAMASRTAPLTDRGTLNAYAAVNVVPLTAQTLVHGVRQRVTIGTTNSGASTYSPDGLPPKPILGLDLMPLEGLELLATQVADLEYVVAAAVNGGNGAWLLLRCAGGAMQLPAFSYGVAPPRFDSSTMLATTGFMSAAGFQFNPQTRYYSSAAQLALAAADVGARIFFNGATAQSVVLPKTAGLPVGASFHFGHGNTPGMPVSVTAYGGASIIDTNGGALVATATMLTGEDLIVTWSGTAWMCSGSSIFRLINFTLGASLSAPGYQKLPSGLIIQWGTTSSIAQGATVSVTFPIAFPGGVLGYPIVTPISSGANTNGCGFR